MIGTTYRETTTRNYTLNGERGIHVRTTEWEITEWDGEFMHAEAVGVVDESGRPPFAGYPTDCDMLVSSYSRRVATGEITEVR